MRGAIVLSLSAWIVTSCARNAVHDIVLDRRLLGRPRAPETVEIVRDSTARPHRVVALVSVEETWVGYAPHEERKDVQILRLRERAAGLGCDAIVVHRSDVLQCGAKKSRCFEAYGHRAECVQWTGS
jgi:hypothetical protein